MRIAKGEKTSDICAEYTVEGVPTADVAVHYADMCGLDLPIFRAVHGLINGTVDIKDAHKILMDRPLHNEKVK